MARRVSLEIVGDSSSLERAFARSAAAARKFNQQVGTSTRQSGLQRQVEEQAAGIRMLTKAELDLIKVRGRRASSLGPFRLAGVGLGATAGLFVATQVVRELGAALEQTGQEAFTTEGRIKNMVSALTSGSVVGAFKALTRQPETLEELGIAAVYSKTQIEALRKVADGTTAAMRGQAFAANGDLRPALAKVDAITKEAKTDNAELARQLLAVRDAEVAASDAHLTAEAAITSLNNWVNRLGQSFVTQTGAVTTFKGAVDDLARPRGPGGVGWRPPPRPGMPTLPDLSPSQRRELDLIGKEGMERIPLLNDRLRQLNNQMEDFHGNQEQRLKILTNIANAEAEIAGIYADQAAKRKDIAGRRNQWFDANIGRQLDRVQDLGLRGQLARLKQIAAEVKARLAVTKDATRRLTLEDTLLGILRQQRSVQADIVDNIKAANDALKDRADAIKSAVLDRLQARQTDILNKRALADAKEQLRIARQIGGPQGIKGAMRGLQDVQFDMMRARLEAAPATLTPTGRFQLGNVVTINVHGVTDPAAVARQVTEILKKRSRRTTTQIRPTAAGQTA